MAANGEEYAADDAHDRREMLRRSLYAGFIAASGGLLAAGCSGGDGESPGGGAGDGKSSRKGGSSSPQVALDLTKADYEALREPGGAARVAVQDEKYPLIIFRASESKALALSARCPHQGCQVQMPRDGRINCPCHGSQFSVTGEMISGPAPSGLASYEVEVDGDTVIIHGVTRKA